MDKLNIEQNPITVDSQESLSEGFYRLAHTDNNPSNLKNWDSEPTPEALEMIEKVTNQPASSPESAADISIELNP